MTQKPGKAVKGQREIHSHCLPQRQLPSASRAPTVVASEGREPGRVEPAYGGHYTGTPAAIIWHFQRTGA
jgi:hypothetical protein